jgi:glycosyltransferase involved in cell wall biosynthesis
MPDLWIIAPVNTIGISRHLGAPLQVGAASRKVAGFLQAIQTVGWGAHLVTTPIIGHHGGGHPVPPRVHCESWGTVHQERSIGIPWLNRALAGWNYLRRSCMLKRGRDHVLFYNFFPEYLPAALLLTLRGMRPHLDVEDYPDGMAGLRSRLNLLSFSILRRVCHSDPVVASEGIGNMCGGSRHCVVHGVVSDGDRGSPTAESVKPLRILFGGTIRPDTGSELAIRALHRLRTAASADTSMEFIVTGFGDLSAFHALAKEPHPSVSVMVQGDLDAQAYTALLRRCHVGLCLKMPDTDVGRTTFPSKSIEIAANGLVLVSTSVSDVPQLFAGAAVLLERAEPDALADALLGLARDPERTSNLARAGVERVRDMHSPLAVGRRLADFLLGDRGESR